MIAWNSAKSKGVPAPIHPTNCSRLLDLNLSFRRAGSLDGMSSNVFVGNGFIRSETSVTTHGLLDGKGFQFSTFFHSTCTPEKRYRAERINPFPTETYLQIPIHLLLCKTEMRFLYRFSSEQTVSVAWGRRIHSACSITRRCKISGVSPGSTSTAFWAMISPPSGMWLT